jgi:hypothetical protein
MRFNFKPGVLVLALVALLALAPAAMAKGGAGGGGGGGGGGTPCATIDNFDMSGLYVDGQPSITWSAQTTNLCIDELAGSTGIDFSNSEDGFTGRAFYAGRGTMTFGSTSAAKPGVTYTITVTVYAPNGKVQATQTKSATAPPALVTAG